MIKFTLHSFIVLNARRKVQDGLKLTEISKKVKVFEKKIAKI